MFCIFWQRKLQLIKKLIKKHILLNTKGVFKYLQVKCLNIFHLLNKGSFKISAMPFYFSINVNKITGSFKAESLRFEPATFENSRQCGMAKFGKKVKTIGKITLTHADGEVTQESVFVCLREKGESYIPSYSSRIHLTTYLPTVTSCSSRA